MKSLQDKKSPATQECGGKTCFYRCVRPLNQPKVLFSIFPPGVNAYVKIFNVKYEMRKKVGDAKFIFDDGTMEEIDIILELDGFFRYIKTKLITSKSEKAKLMLMGL